MPDFTEINCWECSTHSADIGGFSQTNLFYERLRPICTCNKLGGNLGEDWDSVDPLGEPIYCEHILEAQRTACSWHSFYSPEPMLTQGVCPKCGNRADPVRVAV